MIARETPLARIHEAAGAKLVRFAGWLLPLQFGPVAEEAMACRRAAALFDISHMGVISVAGEEARATTRAVLTRDVTAVPAGASVYALLCNERGGILDDLIAMVETDALVHLVVNAANHDADFAWLRARLGSRAVGVSDRLAASFGLALQGPRAEEILRLAAAGDVPPYQFTHAWMKVAGAEALVSRTGYTGEDGFEIFGRAAEAAGLWRALLDLGREAGLAPAGLAARDILRQEMGYPLWGQDLDADTTPLEAGLRWAIDWEGDFVGKTALEQARPERRRAGLVLDAPGIPRHGATVFARGEEVGAVTSGTYSPHLRAGIGQAYVRVEAKLAPGDAVEVEVRGQRRPAHIARCPFVPARTKPNWIKVKGNAEP